MSKNLAHDGDLLDEVLCTSSARQEVEELDDDDYFYKEDDLYGETFGDRSGQGCEAVPHG